MITNTTLMDVQAALMDAMTILYRADNTDPLACDLAGAIVMIYDAIEVEKLERMLSL